MIMTSYYHPELLDRPQNYKELYNLRHSQARNIVERIFGVAKKRFAILRESNEYPILTQAKIVSACGVTHYFIRTFDPDDMPDPVEPQDEATSPLYKGELGAGSIGCPETCRAQSRERTLPKQCGLVTRRRCKRGGSCSIIGRLLK